VTDMWLAGVVL